ncbi:MAG TPA: hydroxyethylthiazole kinase [Syntrophobacteraceae bacterium]|nr:hydroxyethylthiazole kinase [Syntrophobacteraceae bacterium]
MAPWPDRCAAALERLRRQRPLVHQITNFVVMNDTANVTLHIGALPVMAHAPEELVDMVRLAGSLVLNLGTLSTPWIDAMRLAAAEANARSIPIILDPVGAGATPFRSQQSLGFLNDFQIQILRGNLGEVASLCGIQAEVRGVEAMGASRSPAEVVTEAARHFGLTAVVSGATDLVSDGLRLVAVDNGHPWLTTLTGTGCSVTALIGAFAAVCPDTVEAATAGLTCMGIAAEQAAAKAQGPGSFKVAFQDALYHLKPNAVQELARTHEIFPGKPGGIE